MQVWDTAGQESFKSMTRAYYRGSVAAFLVFDVTKRSSFCSLERWVEEIGNNASQSIVIVVIGNKADLGERVVKEEEGRAFASENSLLYGETSAKSGEGV